MNSEFKDVECSGKESEVKIKKRSPIAAAFFTLLVPGLGHFYCGEIKRGFVCFLVYAFYTTTVFALIKFIPGYAMTIFSVITCFPIGMYILIESIIIAVNKKQYVLQFFNKSKYYIAIILTSVYFAGPIEDIFTPGSFTTPTGSMQNTVLPGDYFLTNNLVYGIKNPFTGNFLIIYNKPQNGDIVNFDFKGMPGFSDKVNDASYFKRILAIPGDSFVIKNREVYLNGELYKNFWNFNFGGISKISPEYTGKAIFPEGYKWNIDNYGPIIVPKAGNTVSFDTSSIKMWKRIIRDEGSKLEIIKDRIFINDIEKYSYTFKDNYYFMIGDNWYNSLDSRYFGFVNENDIVSKITMIYFSWDRDIPLKDIGAKLKSIRWERIGKMIE